MKKGWMLFVGVLLLACIGGAAFVLFSSNPEKRYASLMEKAETYLVELDMEQAEAAYLEAIAIAPKKVEAYEALAALYTSQGKQELVSQVITQAQSQGLSLAVEQAEEDTQKETEPQYIEADDAAFSVLLTQLEGMGAKELHYDHAHPEQGYFDNDGGEPVDFYSGVASGRMWNGYAMKGIILDGSQSCSVVAFENTPDPKGRFLGPDGTYTYSVYDGAYIDWIFKYVYLCEPDHTLDTDRCYYADGKYYTATVFELGPYVGHDVKINAAVQNDEGLYVLDCTFYHAMDPALVVGESEIVAGLTPEGYWAFVSFEPEN